MLVVHRRNDLSQRPACANHWDQVPPIALWCYSNALQLLVQLILVVVVAVEQVVRYGYLAIWYYDAAWGRPLCILLEPIANLSVGNGVI